MTTDHHIGRINRITVTLVVEPKCVYTHTLGIYIFIYSYQTIKKIKLEFGTNFTSNKKKYANMCIFLGTSGSFSELQRILQSHVLFWP